jgi:hypothetical protein
VAGWDVRRPSARTAAAVVVVFMVFEGMGMLLFLLGVRRGGR